MAKTFNFTNADGTIISTSTDSPEYHRFIEIAVRELRRVKELKGNIYPSSWADMDNLQDDVRTIIACEVAIQALEHSKQE